MNERTKRTKMDVDGHVSEEDDNEQENADEGTTMSRRMGRIL